MSTTTILKTNINLHRTKAECRSTCDKKNIYYVNKYKKKCQFENHKHNIFLFFA